MSPGQKMVVRGRGFTSKEKRMKESEECRELGEDE